MKRFGHSSSRIVLCSLAALLLLLPACSRPPEPAKEAAKERAESAEPAAKEPPAEAPRPPEPKSEVKKAPEPEAKKAEPPKAEPPKVAKKDLTKPALFTEQAPEEFKVRLETSNGPVTVAVHRSWAPRGADRFYNLVKYGFFDENRFFRIVPNFIVQFGLPADSKVARAWRNANIKDDAVMKTNKRGYLTFATAGPNTRTTQLFINLKDNAFLDSQGFSPFGEVTQGMAVIDTLFNAYGERPEQAEITNRGNAYLKAEFPKLDYIKAATIME
jgi:peptidyl-prolyl cis-trans isomerase A (cyclophilin A)